jgi:uncharacterized protein YdaU (DUF1376 family)
MHVYPHFPDAFHEGTVELTLEETGAYILILNALYSRDGYLPDNIATIAQILRCDIRRARRLRNRLVACGKLVSERSLLVQVRVKSEIAKIIEKSQQARNAANFRWKNSGHNHAPAYASADATAHANLNLEEYSSFFLTAAKVAETFPARSLATAPDEGALTREPSTEDDELKQGVAEKKRPDQSSRQDLEAVYAAKRSTSKE